MMKGVEAVVIGDGDVSGVFQEQCDHVVPLLADSVVQCCVSFRVLKTARRMND
jgi:hypothetical protein